MVVTTYHGETVQATKGDWLVHEYYQGFLNKVYVYRSYEHARNKKDLLTLQESGMMNSPKHFAIREVKD